MTKCQLLGLVFTVVGLGCAGQVTAPPPDLSTADGLPSPAGNCRLLWGLYDASVDATTGRVEIVPLRTAAFNANVQRFLSPPYSPVSLITIKILPGSDLTAGLLELDIGIQHPFPGQNKFRGFDVRGIFMADAFTQGKHDPSLVFSPPLPKGTPSQSAFMLNADGYTRWWNATEFTDPLPLLSFKPGKLGNDPFPSATLNPYKYYADDLGLDDDVAELVLSNRGSFSPSGNANHRLYVIQFPVYGTPKYRFNYAVDASWALPDPAYAPDYPIESFGPGAQTQEAFHLSASDAGSDAYFANGEGGGTFRLDIEVFDWQGLSNPLGVPAEISSIWLEGEPFAAPVDVLPLASAAPGNTAVSSVFHVELGEQYLALQSAGNFECLITVESASPDSYVPQIDNGENYVYPHDAVLSSCSFIRVRVSDEAPEGPPELIATLTGFHSPFCARVDLQKNEAWVDCTQSAPVLDFGFYRIDNEENVEKVFEKTGSPGGFAGMPAMFAVSTEARKILAPDALGMPPYCPVDFWDLDGGPPVKFQVPVDLTAGLAFCFDAEVFADLNMAVVNDDAPKPNGRVVSWDYTQPVPAYADHWTNEFPGLMEADHANHRLFVFCRGEFGGPGPIVEVWDVENWSIITTFPTAVGEFPFMSDIDYDADLNRLYFGSGDLGDFEVWDVENYTHLATVHNPYGAVAGVDHMKNRIYVTAPGRLLVYDALSFELLWDVECGSDPRIVACNPNTGKIYVPDIDQGAVLVFQH